MKKEGFSERVDIAFLYCVAEMFSVGRMTAAAAEVPFADGISIPWRS